jgi:uncharacterized membrane protein YoaK (UPF0700 family)
VANEGDAGDTRDARDHAGTADSRAPASPAAEPAAGGGADGRAPAAAGAPPAAPAAAGFARSLFADSAYGPLYALLLTLTVVTGVVDSVSILALGRVFVANMTGNVVFAAFALVGAPGFSLSASLFALAGFLAGAYVGGVLISRLGRDRGLLLRAGCTAELAFAAVALALAAASGDPGVTHGTIGLTGGAFGEEVADALAALLAVALGVQNAVARRLAVPDMTTTVLTMTLTGIGADIRTLFGKEGRVRGPARTAAQAALGRRLLAVAAMAAGAVAGASLALRVSPLSALALGTALLALATAGSALATRRPAGWRAFPAQKR